ncbi:dephospho-CoA kinase-domain-containing protein [Hysterangium stoloniferum]|nr:dephospho-CoA kinase-domain-containing protein [Hysterangium stoloniferum]
MPIIGLTGGIATGKSTVSSLLKSYGIPVIDADVLAREVVTPGTNGLKKIIAEFGREVLLTDGSLNRARLGEVIFNDEAKRKKLNRIIHPAVQRAMLWNVFKLWLRGERLCVLDVPLLIEAGLWKWMGWIVVVYCSSQVQLTRLMERDGSTESAASSRLNAQMPISQKLAYADYVLDNSGTIKDSEIQVGSLVKRLRRQAGWYWIASWLIPPLGLLSATSTLMFRAIRRRV